MKTRITRTKNAASMIINSSCGFYEKKHFAGLVTVISKLHYADKANNTREIVSELEKNYGIMPDESSWNILRIHPFSLGEQEMVVDCFSPGIVFVKGLTDA